MDTGKEMGEAGPREDSQGGANLAKISKPDPTREVWGASHIII